MWMRLLCNCAYDGISIVFGIFEYIVYDNLRMVPHSLIRHLI